MSGLPDERLQALAQENGIDCLVLWWLREQPLAKRAFEAARLAQLLLRVGCKKTPANDDR